MLDSRCPRAGVHDASEYGYDQWLCELFLFELRMSLSGVIVRGGRAEERERVPR